MTHKEEGVNNTKELQALLSALDDSGQDSALSILRTLEFAQSVINSQKGEERFCRIFNVNETEENENKGRT